MTARIANRNGEPAWKNAPPRLRASQIERPTLPPDPPRRGLWAIIGGRKGA